MSTFIKFPREYFDTEAWREKRTFSKTDAFLYLLSLAPFKDEENLRKGEFKISIRKLMIEFNWSSTKLSNFISYLVKIGYLFCRKERNEVIYSTVKYENYDNVAKPTKVETTQLFTDIKDINAFLTTFSQNKKYLLIAYSFWKLWRKNNENHSTYKIAKIDKWYKDVELLIERDGHSIDRMIAILKYFDKCSKNEAGYDTFWFETIKSVGAFRKVDKGEVFYIDRISDIVNKKLQSSDDFLRLVNTSIKNFKDMNL